jgi:hypothetical protein
VRDFVGFGALYHDFVLGYHDFVRVYHDFVRDFVVFGAIYHDFVRVYHDFVRDFVGFGVCPCVPYCVGCRREELTARCFAPQVFLLQYGSYVWMQQPCA